MLNNKYSNRKNQAREMKWEGVKKIPKKIISGVGAPLIRIYRRGQALPVLILSIFWGKGLYIMILLLVGHPRNNDEGAPS